MSPAFNWLSIRVAVLLSIVTVGIVSIASAGPYLFIRIEPAGTAGSQKWCEAKAARLVSQLQQENSLSVAAKGDRGGFTRESTLSIECIFVGKNTQGERQWNFYIAIASTNEQESKLLLNRIRHRLSLSTPID
jgi:hypothetical protein